MNKSINNIDNSQPQNLNIGDNLGGENAKMFTKEQVNKIVEERLKKEKIKTGALKDLKDAVMNLYERGYFDKFKDDFGKNLSLSDMAGIILEEAGKLGETASANPGNYQSDSNINMLDKAVPQTTQIPISAQGSPQYPEWSTNPRIFELFAQDKNLPSENILNEYLKFVVQVAQSEQGRQAKQMGGDIEAGNTANTLNQFGNVSNNTEQKLGTYNKNLNNMIRSGYNSISPAQSHRTDNNFALTERQRELARAGGMTYKEYSEFINSIPTKKLKK